MSNLISGKEAKLAWCNGGDIQIKNTVLDTDWQEDIHNYSCGVFDSEHYLFRLKPKTITINGKEAAQAVLDGKAVGFRSVEGNVSGLAIYLSINEILNERDVSGNKLEFYPPQKTITLNGIEVAQIVSSQWCRSDPNKVVLEFKSREDAVYFGGKALNIFNDCK